MKCGRTVVCTRCARSTRLLVLTPVCLHVAPTMRVDVYQGPFIATLYNGSVLPSFCFDANGVALGCFRFGQHQFQYAILEYGLGLGPVHFGRQCHGA